MFKSLHLLHLAANRFEYIALIWPEVLSIKPFVPSIDSERRHQLQQLTLWCFAGARGKAEASEQSFNRRKLFTTTAACEAVIRRFLPVLRDIQPCTNLTREAENLPLTEA